MKSILLFNKQSGIGLKQIRSRNSDIIIKGIKKNPYRIQLYKDYSRYIIKSQGQIKAFLNEVLANAKNYTIHEEMTRRRIMMLEDFKDKFKSAKNAWNVLLKKNMVIPFTKKNRKALEEQALLIGIWDSSYLRDALGQLSPFGPTLYQMNFYSGNAPMGIIPALRQQEQQQKQKDNSKGFLVEAQYMADSIYYEFLKFVEDNKLQERLKGDYEYAPLIQNAPEIEHIRVSERMVPTLIVMNQAKTVSSIDGYSAVPHEIGHDILDTFANTAFLREIKSKVRRCRRLGERRPLWLAWIEECFADAIAVMTCGMIEIITLADLFSGDYTDRIFYDQDVAGYELEPDRHPNRHIRVLLTLKVAEMVGEKYNRKDKNFIEPREVRNFVRNWGYFDEVNNTGTPKGHLEVIPKGRSRGADDYLLISKFEDDLEAIANILVNSRYQNLNRKKPIQIFEQLHKPDNKLYAQILGKFDTNSNWLKPLRRSDFDISNGDH